MSIREPLAGVIFLLAQEQADEMAGVAAAWSAAMVELEPAGPGSPVVRSPESDDNPT
jgi:hypothetical protein